MFKYIYKITNLINGKIYIGQSKKPKARFYQHKNTSRGSKLIRLDIEKYGIENFSFEVIEICSNYKEREKYWISFYESNKNGYNKSNGGEEPPIRRGSNCPFNKHEESSILKVKKLLKTTKLSSLEIANIIGSSQSHIDRINNGTIWHDNKEKYPLRLNMGCMSEEDLETIFHLLLNTDMKQKEIAEKFGLSRTTITAINMGANNFREEYDYPLRKKTKSPLTDNEAKLIIYDLQSTNNYKELKNIAIKHNVSLSIVKRINLGSTYRDENISYPILLKNKI